MRDDEVKIVTYGCIAFIVVIVALMIVLWVVPQPPAGLFT